MFDKTKTILLNKGKVAKVSACRFDFLNQWEWKALNCKGVWYAFRRDGNDLIFMHRQIANFPEGMEVDHRDGDGLNNTDKNLRICSHSQNLQNRGKTRTNKTGYKGVTWNKKREKYYSQIHLMGKQIHLGSFDNPIAAAKAYDEKAIEIHGEYANLNFLQNTS